MNLLDDIELPDETYWVDRNGWTPVTQAGDYVFDGTESTFLVEEWVKGAGRPITLQLTNWITGATLAALEAKLTQIENMTLLLNGTDYTVRWRHADIPIESEPVMEYAVPDPADFYAVTLRLVEF